MTEGYVTDVADDDTVMDYPEASIRIELTDLPPKQALAVAREAGRTELTDEQRGKLANGERLDADYCDATFHLTFEQAITALASVEAVALPDHGETDE